MDPQSKKGIMVGYGPTSEMYRVYDSKLDDVFLTRDVLFDEESFAGRKRAFDDVIPRQISERDKDIKQKVRVPVAKKKDEDSDSSAGSSDTEIRSDATSGGSSSESDYDSADEGSEPYTPTSSLQEARYAGNSSQDEDSESRPSQHRHAA